MDIETAVRTILGAKLANSIIADMGVHWAVVAATADARTSDDPEAIAAIRAWLAPVNGGGETPRGAQ